MPITNISRDWGVSPSGVRVTTTDDLAELTTVGYITAQASAIDAINKGAFEFVDGDLFFIVYDGGEGIFTRDATTNSFIVDAVPGSLSNVLANGRVFVGSAGNVATGVAMSGDVAIVASGATTIQNGAVSLVKTTGIASSGANTNISSVYLDNTGLKVKDTDASHGLSIVPGSNLAADRVFTLTTGDNARTLDISAANVTVSAFGASLVDDANAAAARTTLGLAVSSALTVSVPLTTAQFKLIYSTPFLILASGGANTVVRVHDWALELVFGTLPYLNGGATALQYSNTVHGGGILASAATIASATIDGYLASGIVGVAGALPSSDLTDVAATGIYLSCDTAEFDTGDSAVIIHVTYSVMSTV